MSAYYLFGDVLTNAAVGAIAGVACAVLFSPSWPMVAAMLVGMALGMALAFGLASVAGIWFGAFEVQVPAMLSGMVAGMAVAMRAAHEPQTIALGALTGCYCGLAALALTYIANLLLRGERNYLR